MKFANRLRVLHLAVALSLTASLVGCKDEDLAVGLGVIAIGAGVIAIDEATRHSGGGSYHCEAGYRTVCHDYRDYWGRFHRECRSEYESCYHRRWRSHSLIGNGPAGTSRLLTAEQPQLSESQWATTFELGFDGSRTLIDALEKAQSKDLSAILELGFSRDDVKNLGLYSMPSDAGIDAMARKLDQDIGSVRAMIQKILDISVRERDARNSTGG